MRRRYGAWDARTLEVDPSAWARIARATELRAEGLSLRAVGRRLAEAGSINRNGGPYSSDGVQALLTAA
jgi:hypothetical protein